MSCNVGGIERAIRVLVGLALIGLAYFQLLTGGWDVLAYIVGGVALLTGFIGYCPAWAVFRINTCAAKPAKAGSTGH